MNDLISREQAVRFLELKANKPGSCGYLDTKTITDLLKSLPLENGWIPVSKRLPEEIGYYLTSTEYLNVLSDFFCDGKWETAERFWYKVIAWMPLPEPYKEVKG